MDPWLSRKEVVSDTDAEHILSKFEDNFTITTPAFEKLPDSEEYLAILEAKLRRIKNDPNVLRQLTEKKESYMKQLLNEDSSEYLEFLSEETPLSNSQIIRTLLPHKQALNQGELAELVKFDQLSNEDNTTEAELKEDNKENSTP